MFSFYAVDYRYIAVQYNTKLYTTLYIYNFLLNVIIHTNFDGGLTKPPLKVGREWLIAPHPFMRYNHLSIVPCKLCGEKWPRYIGSTHYYS